MKTKLIFFWLLLFIVMQYSCSQQPIAGEWTGKGISFTINESGDSIINMEVVIPQGDKFLAQWYDNLSIIGKKFSSYQDGNDFLGIPKRDLKGEFISNKLAKGTMNGFEWEARPKR